MARESRSNGWAEIRKIRPAIVVSNDDIGNLPLRIIIPFTDWKDRYNIALWMVHIQPDDQNGLTKSSAADTFQIKSVSEQRFIRQIGVMSLLDMERVEQALTIALRINL